MAGSVRAFVALGLPEDHRQRLADHLATCAALAPGYRWVTPAELHLTLRFIGGLEPAGLTRVCGQLARVRWTTFRLALDGRGTFGPRAAPKVVWLGAGDGREACAALASAVEAACEAAGLEAEARPFRAHVTLARQRARNGSPAPLPPLPEPPTLAPWTVTEFVLFQSRLGGGAPRYLALERFALSG